jgi:hypothetical protein
MARFDLEKEMAALATMSPAQMRERWESLTRGPAPKLSDGLLRMALGYELQAKVHGGLSRDARRVLDNRIAGKQRAPLVSPGTRIAREWNGKVHIVAIAEDGGVLWNNTRWRSLSEVARAITGTQWSGPAFFGVKAKRNAA